MDDILFIGNMVRMKRREHNLTQIMLCDLSGVTRVTLSKIERGNADYSIRSLKAVTDALNCNIYIKAKNNEYNNKPTYS